MHENISRDHSRFASTLLSSFAFGDIAKACMESLRLVLDDATQYTGVESVRAVHIGGRGMNCHEMFRTAISMHASQGFQSPI